MAMRTRWGVQNANTGQPSCVGVSSVHFSPDRSRCSSPNCDAHRVL